MRVDVHLFFQATHSTQYPSGSSRNATLFIFPSVRRFFHLTLSPKSSKRAHARSRSSTETQMCPKPCGSALPLWYANPSCVSVPSVSRQRSPPSFRPQVIQLYVNSNNPSLVFIFPSSSLSSPLRYPRKYKSNCPPGFSCLRSWHIPITLL